MLEYLLRILLRLHLAPRKEEWNRVNKLAKTLEKSAKDVVCRAKNFNSENLVKDGIVENLGMDVDDENLGMDVDDDGLAKDITQQRKMGRKVWLSNVKRLLNDLSDVVERGEPSKAAQRVNTIMALLKKLAENPPIKVQGWIPSIDEVMLETMPAMEVADKADDAIPDGDEDNMDDGDNLEGSSNKGHPESNSSKSNPEDNNIVKEPPQRRLNALKAILKKILESPEPIGDTIKWI
ncbi:hypothetical protein BGZ51_006292 [Haplosporangium sp. Z 767]|nr:hypothetical protein BGZ51_006292 [Haplosporangium sp. Z 767]